MFTHVKKLQYTAKPDRPDPVFAKRLQEIVGGQFGEMTVAFQYLFQGWNCRADQKYRDMLLDIGTEEIGHVEILATMIAQLLDDAPVTAQEEAAKDPIIAAAMGGMNPQHAIVAGLGAAPTNSVGVPWNAGYMVASGNLLADFRHNLAAESMGRLQVARLYEMTDDRGVRDMLSFLLARDTMHQNQWAAAAAELEEREGFVVPATFDPSQEAREYSHKFINFSEGEESREGSWAQGPTPDKRGTFEYMAAPVAEGQEPILKPAPLYTHNTLPKK
ncbi:manganese catalase family protein [Paenibacillus sambharensis]|uniref:Manganese catalase family protein n=1 Tax=Paenibacillus sambharensis TaxID=1803190 RepID=A0A2W1LY95_9BACL|nr:manganese catalase family protein [Paenibacillus sambharensis]PZD96487.1 manganese catalase family protein [Paenibacillus sambharensis]